jgi:hypothetical protein
MRYTPIAGLSAALVLSGCTHLQPSPPAPAPAQSGTQQGSATVHDASGAGHGKATPSAADPAAGQSSSSSAQAPLDGAAKTTPQPAEGSVSQAPPARATNGNSKPPAQRNSAAGAPGAGTASGSNGAGAIAPATGTTQPPAANPVQTTARPGAPAIPSLDLASLEERLKETRAIGLFTKLSLKNQVDDLLSQFRAFHAKRTTTPLSALRQRYDLLLLKVLSLLQDGDPPLAAAISGSRESIWAILTDPQKFATL